jgi:hypothetical protein
MISLDGSEGEALALDPSQPRPLLALSHDGLYFARDFVNSSDLRSMPPKTIALEPACSVSGRLVDAATGRPFSGFTVLFSYQDDEERSIPRVLAPLTTDVEVRFSIRGLIPNLRLSVSFEEPHVPGTFIGTSQIHRPGSLKHLTLRAREARDLGDLRISNQAR